MNSSPVQASFSRLTSSCRSPVSLHFHLCFMIILLEDRRSFYLKNRESSAVPKVSIMSF